MANSIKWNPGDKVKLTTGGPEMAVRKHGMVNDGNCGLEEVVECQWFDANGVLHEGRFPPASIEAVK